MSKFHLRSCLLLSCFLLITSGVCHAQSNAMHVVFEYYPEPVEERFPDKVTFVEPNEIRLTRDFGDRKLHSYSTFLHSQRAGNAWSLEDLKMAWAREGLQQQLAAGGGTFRLGKCLDGEGGRKPFKLVSNGVELITLPPDSNDQQHAIAHEDIAAVVYVLTKIYRQQAMRAQAEILGDFGK